MEGRLSCPWSEFQRGSCVGDCVDGLCLNSQSIIAVSFRESVRLQMWAPRQRACGPGMAPVPSPEPLGPAPALIWWDPAAVGAREDRDVG